MNIFKKIKNKSYNLFLSNNYFILSQLDNNNCNLIEKYNKNVNSFSILDDIKIPLKDIEHGDVRVILDINFGIVKIRVLPNVIKQKNVKNTLKLSLEADIGQKLNKHYIAYDVLYKNKEKNIYIVAYTEKEDVILVEKAFKKNGFKVKSISHFVVDFINALIDLNISLPINVVYINKDYYFILKLEESSIDYKKVDIYDFNEQKESILEDINHSAMFLGLEDITLVYSNLFAEDNDFYEKLKNLLHVKEELFPPYDFDCYMLQVNKGVY